MSTSSGEPHPADNEKPQPHPHEHVYVPITNEWDEIVGYQCPCGAYKSA